MIYYFHFLATWGWFRRPILPTLMYSISCINLLRIWRVPIILQASFKLTNPPFPNLKYLAVLLQSLHLSILMHFLALLPLKSRYTLKSPQKPSQISSNQAPPPFGHAPNPGEDSTSNFAVSNTNPRLHPPATQRQIRVNVRADQRPAGRYSVCRAVSSCRDMGNEVFYVSRTTKLVDTVLVCSRCNDSR